MVYAMPVPFLAALRAVAVFFLCRYRRCGFSRFLCCSCQFCGAHCTWPYCNVVFFFSNYEESARKAAESRRWTTQTSAASVVVVVAPVLLGFSVTLFCNGQCVRK